MSASPILALSREIIDEIFVYLDPRKDIRTLKNCCLSSRVLLPSSQRRIFSIVTIYSDAGEHYSGGRRRRIQGLNDILQLAPHAANSVHEIDLQMTTFDNAWVADDLVFLQIMQKISSPVNNIRKLSVTGLSFPDKFADARELEERFLRPFINPVITSLYLEGMLNIPLSIITSSSNLKDLTLRYIDLEPLDPENLDMDAISQTRPKLQCLEFNPAEGAIKTLVDYSDISRPLADLSHLKLVKTSTYKSNLQVIERISRIASKSLEEIRIGNDGDDDYDSRDHQWLSGTLNLSRLSRLHTLDIGVVFPGSPGARITALEDLCKLLHTISTPNSMKTLYLTVFVGFFDEDGPRSILNARWEQFDLEIIRVSSGKRFVLDLQIVYEESEASDDGLNIEGQCRLVFGTLARQKLPKSYSSPYIDIVTRHRLH